MPDTNRTTSEPDQRAQRKLWPWVITSIVALVAALFLTVWVPQEQGEDLLQRIENAGGSYTLDTSDRPEVGSFLEDVEYVELFDRVDHLTLPPVDPELFRDAAAAFNSLEWLEFDLANSPDFDREAAARMTELEWLLVSANEHVDSTDYEFLAGCKTVKHLILTGEFHDDGFWQYLPELKSLTHLQVSAGPQVLGKGIPDLSTSNLDTVFITHGSGKPKFHGFTVLLSAPRLKSLEILGVSIVDTQVGPLSGSPRLEQLILNDTDVTDRMLPILSQLTLPPAMDFSNNELSGDSLDLLASQSLSELVLSNNPLTEEACRNLSNFKKLDELNLSSTGLKTEWLKSWADSPLASSIVTLRLSGNEIGDEAIEILRSFSKLEQLCVDETDLSEDAILKLADHPTLQHLIVDDKVSDETVERFSKEVAERRADLWIHRANSLK